MIFQSANSIMPNSPYFSINIKLHHVNILVG
jgi:hypothetical protein